MKPSSFQHLAWLCKSKTRKTILIVSAILIITEAVFNQGISFSRMVISIILVTYFVWGYSVESKTSETKKQ